ncbi:YdcF family protein [Leptolyngbya sp. FACHB-541]|nr:YdcF family protein [Leptolyngbya sp. FACHB-541]
MFSVKKLRLKLLGWAVAALVGFLLSVLLIIPLRLAIATHKAPHPQAILTLGGNPAREEAAAQLARYHPFLEVWVSTGETPQDAQVIFRAAGVSDNRVHLDYRAVDTVTNFTTLVSDFKQHQIHHVYLVTSDFHMPRARAIATVVLGSQGITFTPIAVPSTRPQESSIRIVRDVGRSLLWIVTRRTGATFWERISSRQ